MRWDPAFQLALAMHTNPGVYALLLGSGISRSAGIPTGWEIVLDLIRRVAVLAGDDPVPDPETWCRQRFGEAPDYARLLDRLLEQALEEVGVVPDVVSSEDALAGALPYVHSRALIVKLHGDYRDTRIKNTPDELTHYSPAFDALLDRILDEFGLVICGWSAKYDTALRDAIVRCPTRRFATYWLARGELDEEARDLVLRRGAQVLPITGADEFFAVLAEQLASLRELDRSHPASVQALVQTVKRYLPEPQHRIRLHELVRDEVEATYGTIVDFSMFVDSLTAESFRARMWDYEAAAERTLAALSAIAYYDDGRNTGLITEAIERLLEGEPSGGKSALIELRKYPAILVAYTAGVGAVAAGRFDTLKAILRDGRYRPSPRAASQSLTSVLHPLSHFYLESYKLVPRPNAANEHTPWSNHLFDVVRPLLREYVPSGQRYTEAFDVFEYILCLNYLDAVNQDDPAKWVPTGAFLWRYNPADGRWDGSPVAEFARRGLERGPDWPLLRAGLFNGSPDQFRRAQQVYAEKTKDLAQRWT